jgi:hypothetical protein
VPAPLSALAPTVKAIEAGDGPALKQLEAQAPSSADARWLFAACACSSAAPMTRSLLAKDDGRPPRGGR